MTAPFDCPRTPSCGQQHTKCAGHRRDGSPCRGMPIAGAARCRMHLGRKVEVVKAEHAAAERARKLYADNGVDPDSLDPLAALIAVAADAEQWRNACKLMVGQLDQLRHKSSNEVRAEVALWERALDRSARILEGLVRLDVESRLVKLEESKAALMAGALDWLLGAFGVAGSDVARAQVAAMLRAVGAGQVPARLDRPVLRLIEVAGEVAS